MSKRLAQQVRVQDLRSQLRDTHITVPGSFNLSDGRRFVQTKVFAETGSRVPTILGEIHDAVAGPIAHVEYAGETLVVEALNARQGWARAYDPAQSLAEQIELVAIIALYGKNGETR